MLIEILQCVIYIGHLHPLGERGDSCQAIYEDSDRDRRLQTDT